MQEQRRPHSPPQFPERSVFDGLARRQVGRPDLVAHSLAVLTPSLSALGTGLALPSIVGPGFWISTLLGFGLAWTLALVFDQFASRFNAAGSLYTYVAKGLGASVALVVGVAMVLGYGVLIGFGLTGGARRLEGAWSAAGGNAPGDQAGWVLVLLCATACVLVMRRGVHWSTRAALVTESVSVALLCTILSVWLVRYGLPDHGIFSLEGASAGRVLAGAALIATLTVAFESCASLGLEADRPLHAVPTSMRTSLLVTGSLFFAANLVGTVRPAGSPLWSRRWFGVGQDVSRPDALALLILAASMLALALCAWTALSRLLFSFAREGIVSAALGRTNAAGVPTVATWCVVPVALAVPLGSWLVGGSATAVSGHLLHASTIIMCIAYACVAAALVPFLWSLDELRPRTAVLAGAALLGVGGVVVDRVVRETHDGSFLALGLLVGVIGTGLAWRAVLGAVQPRLVHQVGAHDEPLAAELLVASGPEDSRGPS